LGSEIQSNPAELGADMLLSPEMVWLAVASLLLSLYDRKNDSLFSKTFRLVSPCSFLLQNRPNILVVSIWDAVDFSSELSHFALRKSLIANRADPTPFVQLRIRAISLISQEAVASWISYIVFLLVELDLPRLRHFSSCFPSCPALRR
jgi:hypothetical protein